ncbi:MAG TPA: TM2 domain-containing protein [Lacipirellula sp.]
MSQASTKYCYACAAVIDARAEICPKCGVRQHAPPPSPSDPAIRKASGDKLMAGICGILLGAFGVHKFVLGYTTAGIIMLAITVLTCGIGAMATGLIGLVEGIIYLTKSDEEFYETYVLERKDWF